MEWLVAAALGFSIFKEDEEFFFYISALVSCFSGRPDSA
jgi:hypothetical protein